eukprot:GHRR01011732.1.p2 GENE.GHRR01011732.1~~GHRR01011732.1.p2  ORF type:complete len:120 (+),score=9.43 GHRR01011732.1:254-613(+)
MNAGAMLSQRHAAERLQTCWHGGGLSLEDVRRQMRDALDEYVMAGSSSEVAAVSKQFRCVSVIMVFCFVLGREGVNGGFDDLTNKIREMHARVCVRSLPRAAPGRTWQHKHVATYARCT